MDFFGGAEGGGADLPDNFFLSALLNNAGVDRARALMI